MMASFYSLLFFGVHFLVAVGGVERISYRGYKVYEIIPKTKEHEETLVFLKDGGGGLKEQPLFWSDKYNYFMFAPHQQGDLLEGIRDSGMEVKLVHEDVQRLIDDGSSKSVGIMDWKSYNVLSDIYQFLSNLEDDDEAKTKWGIQVTVGSIGITYEGRDIKYIKIGKKSTNEKPVIFIDANIHAREWITSAVATYLINELVRGNMTEWLDNFDFVVIPVLNPDGFEYTHSVDRVWRKNRSKSKQHVACRGVDLNRNFGIEWNTVGSKNNSCSLFYAGTSAFSEPETLALAHFMVNMFGANSERPTRKLAGYFSLHSASQKILLSYGFSNSSDGGKGYPFNENETLIADMVVKATAERYGTNFTFGSTSKVLYPVSGSSGDWVKATFNPPVAFTYELRDKAKYKFYLPPDQIIPSALEFMDGFKVALQEILKLTTN